MRFLHTADWQIGMKAAHVGAVGERVRQERLQAAQRVVDVGREQQVEFIVVAGDTFEDNGVDRLLVQRIADILSKFPGPVYLIPGNHDPLVPGSVWEHPAWKAHANLYVLREPTPTPLAGGKLYPCPLTEKYSPRNPTSWIDAHDTDQIAVGLAHGTVEGLAQGERDYPIPRDAAERTGLDYLAIGHWHSYSTFPSRDGAVRLAYSGTHETTKFGERDSGNAVLVEIAGRGAAPRLTPIRTGGLIWRTLDEPLHDLAELTRIREEIEQHPTPEKTLVDLRLSGVLAVGAQAELERLRQLLASRFVYGRLDVAKLLPSPTDDGWLEEIPPGVLRETAVRLCHLADPTYTGARPEGATTETAARALMELYRHLQEAQA